MGFVLIAVGIIALVGGAYWAGTQGSDTVPTAQTVGSAEDVTANDGIVNLNFDLGTLFNFDIFGNNKSGGVAALGVVAALVGVIAWVLKG